MSDTSRLILAAFVALAAASNATSGDEQPAPPAPSPSPSPVVESAPAPEPESKLAVHGYLTQAYAKGTDDHLVLGIPQNGTTDYRRIALQFRYSPTTKDTVVVQIGQRRLGDSPVMQLEPEVKIDWAFYERRFDSGTSIRVGRMATPTGIYNEIRYVGTVLPFYRAPYNYYQEGSYTNETINGIRVSQTIKPASPWNAEVSVFGGGFNMIEAYNGQVNQARAENAVGGQLWLNTPVSGLRFGFGGEHFEIRHSILSPNPDMRDQWGIFIASGEFVQERYKIRSEYSELHLKGPAYVQRAFYVFGSVNVTDKLTANLQHDQAKATLGPQGAQVSFPDIYTDTTAGLDYAFRPYIVAKGEYHWVKARLIEDEGIPLSPLYPAVPANYFIFSVSVSF